MLTIVRTWALDHKVIPDQSDVDYCKNNGIQLDSQKGEHQRIETHGRVYHYRSTPGIIKLTTFDEKSECMLQLRYADRVTLLSKLAIDSETIPYTT
jgi:hypothetical protein